MPAGTKEKAKRPAAVRRIETETTHLVLNLAISLSEKREEMMVPPETTKSDIARHIRADGEVIGDGWEGASQHRIRQA
jgi:hypothetical protein